MKARTAIRVFVVAALLPLLTGCFTTVISHEAFGSKSDNFSPAVFYRSKSDGSLAIEGTLTKAGEVNGTLAYLIIPQKVLVAAHRHTKGDVTFNDIRALPQRVREELSLRKELPPAYEKIADIHNQGGMAVNQRMTVNLRAAKWLPFAFVLDTATFPLEFYFGKKLNESFSGVQ